MAELTVGLFIVIKATHFIFAVGALGLTVAYRPLGNAGVFSIATTELPLTTGLLMNLVRLTIYFVPFVKTIEMSVAMPDGRNTYTWWKLRQKLFTFYLYSMMLRESQ